MLDGIGTVEFNIPLDTLYVISVTIFRVDQLTCEKMGFTANQTATRLQHKKLSEWVSV